jgi:hypothetical protein
VASTARGIFELEHPVEERLTREEVNEYATLGGVHDVEAPEQPAAEVATRHTRHIIGGASCETFKEVLRSCYDAGVSVLFGAEEREP